jgi:hypothetical protein
MNSVDELIGALQVWFLVYIRWEMVV